MPRHAQAASSRLPTLMHGSAHHIISAEFEVLACAALSTAAQPTCETPTAPRTPRGLPIVARGASRAFCTRPFHPSIGHPLCAPLTDGTRAQRHRDFRVVVLSHPPVRWGRAHLPQQCSAHLLPPCPLPAVAPVRVPALPNLSLDSNIASFWCARRHWRRPKLALSTAYSLQHRRYRGLCARHERWIPSCPLPSKRPRATRWTRWRAMGAPIMIR